MLNKKKKGENMDISYLSEMDIMRFKQSGKTYEGVIDKVVNNDFPFVELKTYEVDEIGRRVGSRFNAIVYAQSFEGLEMEWFFEGQGCDNSAIGVAGSWEKIAV